MKPFSRLPRLSRTAFTLIELLTVIAIIAVLMGLLFPAVGAAMDQMRKTQAKNDVTQIVTAVKAFYTDYGTYPLNSATEPPTEDLAYGAPEDDNFELFFTLRGMNKPPNGNHILNPRQQVYFEGKNVKDPTKPKSGFIGASGGTGTEGSFYDPFGKAYIVCIDYNYSNLTQVLPDPYTDLNSETEGGKNAVRTGVIAYSYGKDKTAGKAGNKVFKDSDDILSWQ